MGSFFPSRWTRISHKAESVAYQVQFGHNLRSGYCYICDEKGHLVTRMTDHISSYLYRGDLIQNLKTILFQCIAMLASVLVSHAYKLLKMQTLSEPLDNFWLEPNLYPSRGHIKKSSCSHSYTAEDLEVKEASAVICEQGTSNGIPCEAGDGDTKEEGAASYSYFSDRRDLSNQRRTH
jgi:hypothetical protein